MGKQKSGANKGFAFVIADSNGKPNSGDRKLIRSHVMRGKNTRATQPRVVPNRDRAPITTDSVRTSDPAPTVPQSTWSPLMIEDPASLSDEDEPEGLLRLLRTPFDVFACPFADEIDSSSKEMLFEFYAIIKEAMYPVEWCVRFDASKTPWFHWLLVDPAYLHSVLFTVAMLHDWLLGSKRSKKTNYHICKSLTYLNENIASKEMAIADSTVATIVTMSMVAEMFGDHAASAAHVAGLRQIVKLRGGIESFRHNLQLFAKICRVDIGWSLITGESPVYFSDNLSYEPAFASILGPSPGGVTPSQGPSPMRNFVESLDLRLGYIFQDLQDFSSMVKILFRTQKIDPIKFQQLMTSIQYRLLYLELDDGTMAESLRLAMLGFIATLYLHILGARLRFVWLSNRLRETLQAVDLSRAQTPSSRLLLAWILVIGSTAVFDDNDDVWLLPKLSSLRNSLAQTWPKAKGNLAKVMWIDNIHDAKGVKVFEKLVLHVAQIPSANEGAESEDVDVLFELSDQSYQVLHRMTVEKERVLT
ncbi:hypothetical protein CGMCC3_g13368 [Colletotrichum fructicola]|uniref:Tachykinin family protein n=1 Tax=Colletotrichum fructicola (strain Nara gc5) TaxID=1213859 RepID=L2G092_COLFN|nr:uncharacterized protein CGMCC3_g13368 [Colletotrichum fructicola]KAE9570553.1 hypothetical protein CGMCC3_g13368 [Colletotrichum fructicola]KAF4427633.1 hypothetical protein CFRS1_v006015 [Colletotrichum fructicola]KAF4476801.1 hypothetical protein CGGC5_v014366 [Colletotrichum fructicola Nara gc5]KAF4886669.1 hypothetical protein CGCFRS4_v011059 [Colletotrichum fructicola]